MPEYIFGEVNGVKEGAAFVNRQALREAGIHLAPVAGIDGNPTVGASSIVLNGGYVDDQDNGDVIIYTGHGGNDPGTKKQISDQSWDATGNKALIVSEMHGLPVRVTRGFKHKSEFSPISGYQYGGLYNVTSHKQEEGVDGFMICRFRLDKVTQTKPEINQPALDLPRGTEEPTRIPTTVLRVVRDTKLCREIKIRYNYSCQICGFKISVRGVDYAEAAHIRPLGNPHNGQDTPGNLICLCPNHHVMFDKGIFTINDDLTLVGVDFPELNVHKDHIIDNANLAYHREHIYINDEH